MQHHAARWFKRRGLKVQQKTPYILRARAQWPENIILPEVAALIARTKKEREERQRPFPLHRYVHHGLSSQAMLFNLVGPLLERGDLEALAGLFPGVDIPWSAALGELEYEDREVFNERQAQPTSLDLVLGEAGRSPRLLVEAKLVEQEFGGCSIFSDGDCDGRNPAAAHDDCYLHVAGREYWTCLARHGFLEGPMLKSPVCLLASYYQYFREVLFALERGGQMVFLVDARNPVFQRDGDGGPRGLLPFLEQFFPDALREQVITVTIQQALDAIEATGRHEDWTGSFREKYGMIAAA